MDIAASTPVAELAPTLQRLRDTWLKQRPDYEQRRNDLQRLRKAFHARLDEMAAAVSADFGHRSTHESLLADGMTVLSELDHMIANLRRWMRPQRRGVGWRLWPARAQVRHVARGVGGVLAPWQYPGNRALVPLAVSAGAEVVGDAHPVGVPGLDLVHGVGVAGEHLQGAGRVPAAGV